MAKYKRVLIKLNAPAKKLEKITDKADDKKDKAAGKAANLEAKATEDQVELNERFGRQLDLND